MKTMFLPSGDQMAPSASLDILVIFFGALPGTPLLGSKLFTQTWEPPSAALM
jgi:hypothetical protein